MLPLVTEPKLARRDKRFYADLQDRVSRVRPAVALAFRLFCTSTEARMLAFFDANESLIRHGLRHLAHEPRLANASHLACVLELEQEESTQVQIEASLQPNSRGVMGHESPAASKRWQRHRGRYQP